MNQRRIEVMNEFFLMAICYHFVLFANPVWEQSLREKIGTSVIVFVCVLLGVNGVIMILVNCKALYLKVKRAIN